MPNYWPLSSGNWSNLSNWLTANTVPFNAAILPTSADDVYANNRIIYIDGNYRVNSIRNISAVNIQKGGYFVANNNTSLSAFVYGGGVTDVACLQFLSAAPTTASLVGSLCAGDPSATVLRPIAFSLGGTGSFTITGNCLGIFNNGSSATASTTTNGAIINNGGNLTIFGNISGDVRSAIAARALMGVRHNSGTTTIYGNIFGGTSNDGAAVYAQASSSGTLTVFGSCLNLFNGLASACIWNDTGSFTTVNLFGDMRFPVANNSGGYIVRSRGNSPFNIVGNLLGSGGNGGNGLESSTTTNITGAFIGGSGIGALAIVNIGTLNILGSVQGGSANSSTGITNNGGVVSLSGSVIGGIGGVGATGIANASVVIITGNVFGGSGSEGITQTGSVSAAIIGTVFAGTGARGASNTGTIGRMFIRRVVGNGFGIGSSGVTSQVGVDSGRLSYTTVEEIQCGPRGQFPTSGNIFISKQPTNVAIYAVSGTGGFTPLTMYGILSASNTNLVPFSNDVRQSVVYAFGNSVGTLAMPIPAVVNSGVPVDNTVGTGVFTPLGVWNLALSAVSDTITMGGRVKNSPLMSETGDIITTLN